MTFAIAVVDMAMRTEDAQYVAIFVDPITYRNNVQFLSKPAVRWKAPQRRSPRHRRRWYRRKPSSRKQHLNPPQQCKSRTQHRVRCRSGPQKKALLGRKLFRKQLRPLSRSRNLQRTFSPRPSMPRRAMLNQSLHRSRNLLPNPQHRQTGRRHRRCQRLCGVTLRRS